MAIFQHEQCSSSLLDELYCEEEKWEDEEQIDENNNNNNQTFIVPIMLLEQDMFWEDEEQIDENNNNNNNNQTFIVPIMLLEQDMFWEDDELESLFTKEKQGVFNEISLISARKQAVEWMLKVNSLYGFCALTSILSVNYFDRCISSIPFIQQVKPWTVQLAAVTCLSLAAKVEETDVPLLLDLQVEGARPVFEPRDMQKMELLVLSTLEWKMHPVTPLSFLDHIIRRLGLKNHLHWEFLKRCEDLLLSLLSDWRFVSYLPSVLATATMMHVINQIQHCNALDYQTQLLSVLNISKEKVNDCYELIVEKLSWSTTEKGTPSSKRKFDEMTTIPTSPSGVMDAYNFSSESSNESWTPNSNTISGPLLSASSSVSSSPVISQKKGRVYEQPMPLQLPPLSRVFVDLIASPR